MRADLDLLLTAVLCTADDLLPEGKKNARRRVADECKPRTDPATHRVDLLDLQVHPHARRLRLAQPSAWEAESVAGQLRDLRRGINHLGRSSRPIGASQTANATAPQIPSFNNYANKYL